MLLNKKLYPYIIFILAATLTLWAAIHSNLNPWDESRNGGNAYEMAHNHDYINLYWGGEPDTWNAKPPLLTWLIVLCYKIFGYNEFALRFPSAIATLLFFMIFYRMVKLREGSNIAFSSCLVLLSCKGILGMHAGIAGDFDALLLLWLTASAYYFIRFIDDGKRNAIWLVALFTGLAFYTKSTAAFIALPGFVLYALLTQKARVLFGDRRTWLACMLFLLIAGSWIVLILKYGKTTEHSAYGTKNNVEAMLLHDTYRRMAASDFETPDKYRPERLFVIHTLDSRFNILNYFFYLSIATGMVLLYRQRKNITSFLQRPQNRFTVFSLCQMLPLFILLTVARNKHDWYMVPIWGYVAFVAVKGVFYLGRRWKPLYWIAGTVLCFCLGRHACYIFTLPSGLHHTLNTKNVFFKEHKFIIVTSTPQDLILYMKWLDLGFNRMNDWTEHSQYKGQILLAPASDIAAAPAGVVKPLKYFDDYCLAEILQ